MVEEADKTINHKGSERLESVSGIEDSTASSDCAIKPTTISIICINPSGESHNSSFNGEKEIETSGKESSACNGLETKESSNIIMEPSLLEVDGDIEE